MSQTRGILKRTTAIAIATAAVLSAYSYWHFDDVRADAEPTATAEAAPAPQVEVVTITPQTLRPWHKFSGRLTAVDYVEIRPRVGGTIQKVAFQDGDHVNKGDLLFVIDPRPFEAAVSRAEAALVSARSEVELAKAELKRAGELLKQDFVSRSAYDKRSNDFEVAEAKVQAYQAELTTARLNLDYAYVKAPVSGIVSRPEITLGNVIEAGASAPVLTTLVSNDKLYAEFDVDERTYVAAKRQSKDGGDMPVELTLAGDESVVYEGKLYSFDNKLDLRSGTIRARAILDNTDGALTPGMFADIRLGAPGKEQLIVVPDRAVGTDQDKKFVYTVGQDGVVQYKEIKLGQSLRGGRVVLSGLNAGDRVIVNGLQKVRPNVVVTALNATVPADEIQSR